MSNFKCQIQKYKEIIFALHDGKVKHASFPNSIKGDGEKSPVPLSGGVT